MYVHGFGLELGFVVNLKTLREVLQRLSINGRHWWIACDPQDASDRGYVSIGYGDPKCEDCLNTVYFRFPILNDLPLKAPTDRLLLLVDPTTCVPESPGFYLEDGRVVQDAMQDFMGFYPPLQRALIARLQAESGSD
jgi:hypothetical protein